MGDIKESKIHELVSAADIRLREDIVASVAQETMERPADWTNLLVDEAAVLDKRLRFLHRYSKLPNVFLRTNVPVKSRSPTIYERRSWHSPLMFETQPEYLDTEEVSQAITSGMTVSSYLHPARRFERSVTVKRWGVSTRPDGVKTKAIPDLLVRVEFNPDSNDQDPHGEITGEDFDNFASDCRQLKYKEAHAAGKIPDYDEAMKDLIYPDKFYIDAFGLLRLFKRALRSTVNGSTDLSQIDKRTLD